MKELVCNLHIHSKYSDGTGTYQSIAEAAIKSGVDVVIVTDHNIRVDGMDGYRSLDEKKVLLLVGEEIHDQTRNPQKNHTLCIGAEKELSQFAYDPQLLMDEIRISGGLSFLAHPYEFDLKLFHEPDISWVSWDVKKFTGLELWNGLSELKTVSRSLPSLLINSYNPELIPHGPLKSALDKWDELLCKGRQIVAVGGSDAHCLHIKIGPIRKTIFPYEYHFSAINNHLLVEDPLSGDIDHDKALVYQALRDGSSFIGYDLPASTRGFEFTIENQERRFSLGNQVDLSDGGTVRVHLPEKAEIRLIHNGQVAASQAHNNRLITTVTQPGYYRVECYKEFRGKQRGWIFSNPIYTTVNDRKRLS